MSTLRVKNFSDLRSIVESATLLDFSLVRAGNYYRLMERNTSPSGDDKLEDAGFGLMGKEMVLLWVIQYLGEATHYLMQVSLGKEYPTEGNLFTKNLARQESKPNA